MRGKEKSLRRMVAEALESSPYAFARLSDETIVDIAGHVARKLGGRYVKTQAGWRRKVRQQQNLVERGDCLPTEEFLRNQAKVLRAYSARSGYRGGDPEIASVAKSLDIRANLVEAGVV